MRKAQFLTVALLALVGCDWLNPSDDPEPNKRPTAEITGGVTDGGETHYRVEILWAGSDSDGYVDHFLYAIDDVWNRTEETSGDFLFSAQDPVEGAEWNQSHEWHSFHLKAVDDDGAESAPDVRHFNAITFAPSAWIVSPRGLGTEGIAAVGRPFTVRWMGRDEDASQDNQLPVGYQLKLVEIREQIFYLSRDEFLAVIEPFLLPSPDQPDAAPNLLIPDSLVVGDPDSLTDETYLASDWYTKVDAPLPDDLMTFDSLPQGNYVFAVRAIDEARAVMPAAAFNTAGEDTARRGNILKMDVIPALQAYPYLSVTERTFLGSNFFSAYGREWRVEVPPEVPLYFEWEAFAEWYGGSVGDFRYAIDPPDPNCEECEVPDGIGGWTPWGDWTRIPFPIEFDPEDANESHTLYVEVRDASGDPDQRLRAVIIMNVVNTFTFSDPALWIDDFKASGIGDCEHDAIIEEILDYAIDPYLSGGQELPEWQSRSQIGDCYEGNNARVLQLEQMGRYKLLFWNHAGHHSSLAQTTWHPSGYQEESSHYLSAYVRAGGNLIIWGHYTIAGLLGGYYPADRYIPDLPQFQDHNFGPGTFLWDVLNFRTRFDRAGRGDGPGSQQMALTCSGLIGIQATQTGQAFGFPAGLIDPTGYSSERAIWVDDWSGHMNPHGWSGGNAMIGDPPLHIGGMDTLYTYTANSFAWEDDLAAACGSSFHPPLHKKPVIVRYEKPYSHQGKVVWIGLPLYPLAEYHMDDLKQMMRKHTEWILEE